MPSADWLACTAAPHQDSGKCLAPPILSLQNRRPLRSRLRSSDALGASLRRETNFWPCVLFVPRRQRSLDVPEPLISWCPQSRATPEKFALLANLWWKAESRGTKNLVHAEY